MTEYLSKDEFQDFYKLSILSNLEKNWNSEIPKCINVTDGAAGTCSICDPDNKLCAACNYPEIFEPDQKGGCVIKTQSQCTESYYG